MYANQFAAAIKVDGKILREFSLDKDTVYLPFGSEYSIVLKNLNTQQRSKVSIDIDGTNVTGGGLLLDAGETTTLERSLANGNLKDGNKFKFIQMTSKIEEHRGVNLEDGIVTITYEFEKNFNHTNYIAQTFPYYPPGVRGINRVTCDNLTYSIPCSSTTDVCTNYVHDAGITVEGSHSDQQFSTGYWNGSIGQTHRMIFKLLGETEYNATVREPVTVKTKIKCKTCGTINPATAKFCSECGTSLQIV